MYACDINLTLQKSVSITTDGRPVMLGSTYGLVGLCRRDQSIPVFIVYRCIIHQEALCRKVANFEHVLIVVTEIINSTRSVSLKHRLFTALLEDVE
jgi:hypothetical protein